MTERERFIKALKREPIEGHCPTFELVFFLTLEAIGKIHPSQQRFDQWNQMSKTEQKLHIDYIADVRRSLRDGMNGWGYMFCTSNCAYTGLPLERYELMNRIWYEEGIYK